MKLQTTVEIEPFKERIDYSSRILTIGSCFADRVGEEMSRAKFHVEVNPMGVLFNPISLFQSLERLAERRLICAEELIEGRGGEPAWYNFSFHSSLSRSTREESCNEINRAIERGHKALLEADFVVITLGTAWLYELIESGEVVANCHKRPAKEFHRRRLNVEEIVTAAEPLLRGALKEKRVIFTVSPIRHLGDGLAENSLSKATLRLAASQICEQHSNVEYFPSFEIVMDELRDYRFYERDMVHIAPVAVEYIWERFTQVALTKESQDLLPRVMQIVRAAEHRAVNPNSESHKKFAESQLKAIKMIPEVEFREEIEKFESVLKINL